MSSQQHPEQDHAPNQEPSPLAHELEAYRRHRAELLATAAGRFALVHDDEVAGTFETQMDAISQGYRQLGPVPFLVKHILQVEVPENYVSNLLAI